MHFHHAFIFFIALFAAGCGSDVDKGKRGTNTPVNTANGEPGSSELTIGTPSGDLVEGAPPVTVELSLTRAPTNPVTIDVTSQSSELVVEPAQLVFDTNTFQTPQRISLSVADNGDVTGDRTAQIDFTLTSEDPTFNAKPVTPLVVPVLEDDSTPSYEVVSNTGVFEVTEQGDSIVLDITLSVQPDGDVLVPLSIDDADEADIDVTQMTFGELNWNLPQKVTITGIDDMEADGDTAFNLILGPSNSTGTVYNGAPALNVSIVNIDGVCGNGLVDGAESCEPMGNPSQTCPYGEMSCTYCTDSCESAPGTVSGFCGDGAVQGGNEECDAPTQRCPYGQMSCTTCSNCREVAGQLTGYCGDGTVQQNAGEACDPGVSACCDSNCQPDTASNCGPDCLIISHYVEGAGQNKAFSIYNCGSQPEPLAGVTMCLYRNADTTCSAYYNFSGSIAAGGVYTICNDQAVDPSINTVCDDFESNITSFNGDDRLALFVDLDGNNSYTTNDAILDAFGELTNQPITQLTWSDRFYQRCDFTTYDGTGSYIAETYFQQLPNNDFSQLDDVPTQGCP